MFEKIAGDLQEKLGVTRTGEQCCSRYKTVHKRKRPIAGENSKPAESSQLVSCENPEILSIAAGTVSRESCADSSDSELLEKNGSVSPVRDEAPDSDQEKEWRAEKRKCRPSTARMRDMRFFFEKLEEIEERKAKRRAKRDTEREKRLALKLQRREEMHREKMDLLRKVFGLNEEQE